MSGDCSLSASLQHKHTQLQAREQDQNFSRPSSGQSLHLQLSSWLHCSGPQWLERTGPCGLETTVHRRRPGCPPLSQPAQHAARQRYCSPDSIAYLLERARLGKPAVDPHEQALSSSAGQIARGIACQHHVQANIVLSDGSQPGQQGARAAAAAAMMGQPTLSSSENSSLDTSPSPLESASRSMRLACSKHKAACPIVKAACSSTQPNLSPAAGCAWVYDCCAPQNAWCRDAPDSSGMHSTLFSKHSQQKAARRQHARGVLLSVGCAL